MLRKIVAGLLVLAMPSCTRWVPVTTTPETYIRMHDPEEIRVRLQDSSEVVLGRPRIFSDTLRGIFEGGYRNIPLNEVVQVKAEEPARKKTAVVIAVSSVLAVGAVYLAANSDHTSK